jgi:hypothetical protein
VRERRRVADERPVMPSLCRVWLLLLLLTSSLGRCTLPPALSASESRLN